jgi:hypothetical protein
MKKADVVMAIALALLGVVVTADAVRLGFGWGPSGPEGGFFPFYLGTGLIACSAIVLIKALRDWRKHGDAKRLVPEGAWKPLVWVFAPALGMVVLTELVGLHVSAALYLAFYMLVVGKISWKTTLAVSLIAPVVLYIAFDKVFMVPLPQGLWGGKLIPF